jgi:hypothetical protein
MSGSGRKVGLGLNWPSQHHSYLVHEKFDPEKLAILLAERVGFEALNAELCTALHGLVREGKTKGLLEFRLSLDFIDVF